MPEGGNMKLTDEAPVAYEATEVGGGGFTRYQRKTEDVITREDPFWQELYALIQKHVDIPPRTTGVTVRLAVGELMRITWDVIATKKAEP